MNTGTAASFLDSLWAKSSPRHPLWKHLLDTAAVSLGLRNPLERFGWTAEQTALVVGLHDIGKADAGFQHQIGDYSDELARDGFIKTADARCRHERLSCVFVKAKLEEGGLDDYTASAIARALAAHHGYWIEDARGVAKPYLQAQENLYALLKEALGTNGFPADKPEDLSAFGMLLCGHIVLCDWIASNEKFYTDAQLKDGSVSIAAAYLDTARGVAQGWIAALELKREAKPGIPDRIVTSPRPIQKALLDNDIPPGLVIIEAPMGEGKTEAAWILAEKWRQHGYHGLYMALPTMATSDSLHSRYRDAYLKTAGRGEDVKLVHGMAWLRDDKEPETGIHAGEPRDGDKDLAAAWFRPTRRAMLAAHGVGTVDQVMLAGMHVKFGFLRLYGLAGRVLVIDEVHAYDAYMSAILCRLLQWCACLKIPVILLSATLSASQRADMIEAYGGAGGDPGPQAPYPLITGVEAGKPAWTLQAKASAQRVLKLEKMTGLLGDAKKTAVLAAALVRDGGCCCVILNTVKQAQAVYRELGLPKSEKLLFHARFTAEDREKITNRVLKMFGTDKTERPKKFVLVATQVVEQSLDVDFDHMVSEIAPMDLLLQRSGRLHRHGKREDGPQLHILLPDPDKPEWGGTAWVYQEKPLLRTAAILGAIDRAVLPDDFRTLVEKCYGTQTWDAESVDWDAIAKADKAWITETEGLESKAGQFSLKQPKARFFNPVNNDPTGDDSDDGNGWRGKTRVGANDRTAVLLDKSELASLSMESLGMADVRRLYRRALKLAPYIPFDSPAEGYGAAIRGEGRLRGLTLLPLTGERWQGQDPKGNRYEVTYDVEEGLKAGRIV